ncbi:arabinose efflux permease family protein [Actinoalloteichus hymeniacidonis]|uniref:Arabinose efflux permease family protein n=2 Tax=Actinoalloteichus hymeniacidonis TaxID=340345 RepID=A0AAC9MZS0_9PSEU|nr:arabinose efflux permease family protein [Actinoalloteichus hymeniacidonis]
MYLPAIQLLAADLAADDRTVSGIRVAMTLPPVMFILLAGAAADRLHRRRLMILADVVRAVTILAFAVITAGGLNNWWLLLAVVMALGASQTFHDSSAQALLPQLVPAPALVQANGVLTAALTLGFSFAGPALGGVLFSWNISLPFFVNAVTFAVSGVLIHWIRAERQADEIGRPATGPATGVLADIRAGLGYTRRHPLLRSLSLLGVIVAFAVGMVTGIFVLFATRHLALGPIGYGMLLIGEAIGALVGSAIALRLSGGLRRRGLFRALPVVLGVIYLVEASTRSLSVVFATIVIGNTAFLIWVIMSTSVRQEAAPIELAGRINSVYRLGVLAATGFGAIIGGLLSETFGVLMPFVAGAAVLLVIPWCVPLRGRLTENTAERDHASGGSERRPRRFCSATSARLGGSERVHRR